MELKDKTIVITGAGGAIGRILCQRFCEESVVVKAIDRDSASLSKLPDSCETYTCDLTREESVEQLFADLGDFDVLVQAAGVIENGPIFSPFSSQQRLSLDSWRSVVDINLQTCFLVGSFAIECFLRQRKKGVIINIGSIMSDGQVGQSAYAAAKAGVHAMTKVWAKEVGHQGVRCVAVAPGFIDTRSTREALSKSMIEELEREVPLRRLGRVEEVSQCVKMIIENEYINGTVVRIDGGISGL